MIEARRAETVADLLDLEPAPGKFLCRATQPSNLSFDLGTLRIDHLQPANDGLIGGRRRPAGLRV